MKEFTLKLLYIPCSGFDEAKEIASTLIEEKLIACANIQKEITSVYKWEGAMQSETESLLILKTSDQLAEATSQRVHELHSYDCPCILSYNAESESKGYADWIIKQLG